MTLRSANAPKNPGDFEINAQCDNKRVILNGTADGILTWNGKNILTTGTDGLEISKAINGYIRDKRTGFTLQWGIVSVAQNSGTVTFPRAFSTTYSVVITEMSDKARSNAINQCTNTNFKYYLSAEDSVYWMATGIS